MGNRVDVSNGINLKAGQLVKFHLAPGTEGTVEVKECYAERVFGTIHVWGPGTRKCGGRKSAKHYGMVHKIPMAGRISAVAIGSPHRHKWGPSSRSPLMSPIPGDE